MSTVWLSGEELPGWDDHGTTVEVEWHDGVRLIGRLDYDDTTPGPDEWPIFFLTAPNGTRRHIADMKRWRMLAG